MSYFIHGEHYITHVAIFLFFPASNNLVFGSITIIRQDGSLQMYLYFILY